MMGCDRALTLGALILATLVFLVAEISFSDTAHHLVGALCFIFALLLAFRLGWPRASR